MRFSERVMSSCAQHGVSGALSPWESARAGERVRRAPGPCAGSAPGGARPRGGAMSLTPAAVGAWDE